MSLLTFRIDWGYSHLYSLRDYHPVCVWDGHLECTDGVIRQFWQLDYPYIHFGPGHSPREIPLAKPEWHSRTHRGFSGVKCTAEVTRDTRFKLVTASGSFEFSARQIREEGRIVFPVGPKYLRCRVFVTRDRHYWFRPAPKPGQQIWEADDIPGTVRDWSRMRMRWLAAGESCELRANIPPARKDHAECLLHLQIMGAPKEFTPGDEKQVLDYFPITLFCDDRQVWQGETQLRSHDTFMQMLEDLWIRFPHAEGPHTLTLRNDHPELSLLISRAVLQNSEVDHLEFSLPPWGLVNEPLIGRIYATKREHAKIQWPGGVCERDLRPGWNEFDFVLTAPGVRIPFSCGTSRGELPAIYDLPEESPAITVGFDMTVVPHDDESGLMDWLLDYTERTRLGNLVVFRAFLKYGMHHGKMMKGVVAPGLMKKWGEFCRRHHIWAEAANNFESGELTEGAGEMLHTVGPHEWGNRIYVLEPTEPWSSANMKEAAEHYVKWMALAAETAHKAAPRAGVGDTSGGQRYAYMAGIDFIRTETYVANTVPQCAQARAAAEVFHKGPGGAEWGVHIAIQHAFQPYDETHLGCYYLSMMLPWLMGAKMIYEEDSLFLMFKEERQSWDDALTKGKRDMTREFFRFAKTHPRQGTIRRSIAFIEGRYAAPFNGFTCYVHESVDYPVWGYFGSKAPEWSHRQPEKCRQILDVLTPGASTIPLQQRFDRRRFYFTGTPYGDFDEIPAEAPADYMQNYTLLLHLGWNTMIDEDHRKLLQFVRNGGTLLIGLPQCSTHTERKFLLDMDDLALYRQGDLRELCGFKVNGPGPEYCGQWNCSAREAMPRPELSAMPTHSPMEDGPCRLADLELAGAEPFIWDARTGLPIVTRFSCGKGTVYCLTAFAYFGHERLQDLSASLVARLCDENAGDIRVEDPSRELFWNVRQIKEQFCIVSLLNTDWTTAGNRKQAIVRTPGGDVPVTVTERQALFLLLTPGCAVEYGPGLHPRITGDGRVIFHGIGRQPVVLHDYNGTATPRTIDFQDACEQPFTV